ncbi:hypothetical protein AVEN_242195-1 [Araneus ventricosus]|uniref:Uncharacterized protein n=1 Tax=Araneus ventricosus TaxID=182803 RepID=A0A4Y2QZW4_ARAVE|nr:hypothetical protein AVEN_242195-1 [Araneus ventricosus]
MGQATNKQDIWPSREEAVCLGTRDRPPKKQDIWASQKLCLGTTGQATNKQQDIWASRSCAGDSRTDYQRQVQLGVPEAVAGQQDRLPTNRTLGVQAVGQQDRLPANGTFRRPRKLCLGTAGRATKETGQWASQYCLRQRDRHQQTDVAVPKLC